MGRVVISFNLCDDAIFVASCVNDALAHEVSWSYPKKYIHSGNVNAKFSCYNGIIDGTLFKICKPWKDPQQSMWLNVTKKIYSMNNNHCCVACRLFFLPHIWTLDTRVAIMM